MHTSPRQSWIQNNTCRKSTTQLTCAVLPNETLQDSTLSPTVTTWSNAAIKTTARTHVLGCSCSGQGGKTDTSGITLGPMSGECSGWQRTKCVSVTEADYITTVLHFPCLASASWNWISKATILTLNSNIYLIHPESRVLAYIFAPESLGLSSFTFLWWALNSKTHLFCTRVHIGHSRSPSSMTFGTNWKCICHFLLTVILTLVLSCTISKIRWVIGRKL